MTLREKLTKLRVRTSGINDAGWVQMSGDEATALIDVALAVGDIEDALYNQRHTAVIEAIAKLDKALE